MEMRQAHDGRGGDRRRGVVDAGAGRPSRPPRRSRPRRRDRDRRPRPRRRPRRRLRRRRRPRPRRRRWRPPGASRCTGSIRPHRRRRGRTTTRMSTRPTKTAAPRRATRTIAMRRRPLQARNEQGPPTLARERARMACPDASGPGLNAPGNRPRMGDAVVRRHVAQRFLRGVALGFALHDGCRPCASSSSRWRPPDGTPPSAAPSRRTRPQRETAGGRRGSGRRATGQASWPPGRLVQGQREGSDEETTHESFPELDECRSQMVSQS